ncbi:MAG: flagellar filament outer layer protein FlaA [Brevinema sp.]
MKRANLQRSIALFALAVMAVPFNVYGQHKKEPFVFKNFTLSDFGDGSDTAQSIVWKPTFSEFAVQAKGEDQQNTQDPAGGDQQNQATGNQTQGDTNTVVVLGQNPDPNINAVRYSEAVPEGVTDLVSGPQKYVLGVKAQFTQQGYNWIELYPHRIGSSENQQASNPEDPAATPAQQATPTSENTTTAPDSPPDLNAESTKFKIPFKGIATDISMWVWGGYYAWWVELYVRDYLNYDYQFPMGDLLYTGWKQKRVQIPSSVIQTRKRLPAIQSLSFEKIKLWSFPTEHVNQFYVYFDLLQHGSIVEMDVFNGKNLAEDIW